MAMGFRSLQRNPFILLFCFSNGWAVGKKFREKKIKYTNNKNLYVSWIFINWAIKHILTKEVVSCLKWLGTLCKKRHYEL